MKFKHTQRILELEETSGYHLDHLLAPRQIQLYLQDTVDRYLSDWFLPAYRHISAGNQVQHVAHHHKTLVNLLSLAST